MTERRGEPKPKVGCRHPCHAAATWLRICHGASEVPNELTFKPAPRRPLSFTRTFIVAWLHARRFSLAVSTSTPLSSRARAHILAYSRDSRRADSDRATPAEIAATHRATSSQPPTGVSRACSSSPVPLSLPCNLHYAKGGESLAFDDAVIRISVDLLDSVRTNRPFAVRSVCRPQPRARRIFSVRAGDTDS
jgi:hypothetical protein